MFCDASLVRCWMLEKLELSFVFRSHLRSLRYGQSSLGLPRIILRVAQGYEISSKCNCAESRSNSATIRIFIYFQIHSLNFGWNKQIVQFQIILKSGLHEMSAFTNRTNTGFTPPLKTSHSDQVSRCLKPKTFWSWKSALYLMGYYLSYESFQVSKGHWRRN